MSTYTVRAKRWKHGWEMHVDGIGVTQSRNLDGAEQMVRDYVETLTATTPPTMLLSSGLRLAADWMKKTEAARAAVAEAERAAGGARGRAR